MLTPLGKSDRLAVTERQLAYGDKKRGARKDKKRGRR